MECRKPVHENMIRTIIPCVWTRRSHKGSNLALMVELLAGPLVGAAVADKLEERNWGNLVLVIDPQLLGEPDVIKARTQVGVLTLQVACCVAYRLIAGCAAFRRPTVGKDWLTR